MKKLPLILILLVTGCSSNEINYVKKPDYLTVYNHFKNTEMFDECNKYEEEIKRKTHETHRHTLPYSTKSDMEIISDDLVDGVYTASLSCKVEATYSLSSTTFIKEEFEKSLKNIIFNY